MSFFKTIIDSLSSAAKDSAEFLETNLINPVSSFVNHPRYVLKEAKILEDLQQSNGSRFPGDDYRPSDRKNWMSNLNREKLTLNKIVWPGTHNSAVKELGSFTRPFGECQTLNIYEQLEDGVRVLDIRVQENRLICHEKVEHCHVDAVLHDVIKFVKETDSEIIILEIRTEFGHKDPPGFDTYLLETLGQFLIKQDDNLFNKLVSEILPKRVICIWKPSDSPKPNPGGFLWNSDYLRDNCVDTNLPWTKFQRNLQNLSEQSPVFSRNYFYRIENTLNPQMDNLPIEVRAVSVRIRNYARLFISESIARGCGDKLQILSTDFIGWDLVDACVGLTYARIQGRV